MKPMPLFVISGVALAVMQAPTFGCSFDIPSVTEAVRAAEVVAIGIVDSVVLDDSGVLKSAIFKPNTVLKGTAATSIFLRRPPWADVGTCADVAIRPYASGERVAMILVQDEDGGYTAPVFAPWLTHLSNARGEEEHTLVSYLRFAIEEGVNPIQVVLRGNSDYAVGRGVVIDLSVTNRLDFPVVVSMDRRLTSDTPIVKFYIDASDAIFDPEVQVPENSLWTLPGRTTMDMKLDLEDYFGRLSVDHYLMYSYVHVPTGRSYELYDHGGQGYINFIITAITVVIKKSWGGSRRTWVQWFRCKSGEGYTSANTGLPAALAGARFAQPLPGHGIC
jgi:hypothetical protein